ncbi:MAG: hypothetical protein RRY64_00300 [Oscillospiraceae bacterium]
MKLQLPPRLKKDKKPPGDPAITPDDQPPADPQAAVSSADALNRASDKRIHSAAARRGMMRLITRDNAVNMALVVLFSIVAVVFLLSLVQGRAGSFTISLAKSDRYEYGIELGEDAKFTKSASRLEADAIQRATNISIADLPVHLDREDGSHNGPSYMAYTFYVRNNGKSEFDYRYQITTIDVTRALDTAARVAVYYNGQGRQIYALPAANGKPEPGTIPFSSKNVVEGGTILDMKVGSVDKYTVVIWIEGDDPECTDDRLGGIMKLSMNIDVIPKE